MGVEKALATPLCPSQEYDPRKATFVKVVPTPNNGSTELVALHRDEVGTDQLLGCSAQDLGGTPRPDRHPQVWAFCHRHACSHRVKMDRRCCPLNSRRSSIPTTPWRRSASSLWPFP